MSLVVRFALASGCRMSEILHLEWRRVAFGRRVAWLDPGTTKNGEGPLRPKAEVHALMYANVQPAINPGTIFDYI